MEAGPDDLARRIEGIDVVYTDVDGTLVSNGCLFRNRHGLTLGKAKAIHDLHRADVDVVMVSGRSKDRLKGTARLLGFRNYIGNLGMQIVYDGGDKVIQNYGVDVTEPAELKDWIDSTGVLGALFDEYGHRLRLYAPWAETLETHYLLIGEVDDREVNRWLQERFPRLRIIDNGAVPPEDDFAAPHAFHLLPRVVGKGAAVRIDKRERGLETARLIAMGDSREDLRMAEEVAIFFALDESLETDRDNVVTVDNRDEDGFVRIVETLRATGLLEPS